MCTEPKKALSRPGHLLMVKNQRSKNLYLCGASILSHGVAGASTSGVTTAAMILGCTQSDLLVPQKDQNIRIYDAENETAWPQWILQKREDKIRGFREIDFPV